MEKKWEDGIGSGMGMGAPIGAKDKHACPVNAWHMSTPTHSQATLKKDVV